MPPPDSLMVADNVVCMLVMVDGFAMGFGAMFCAHYGAECARPQQRASAPGAFAIGPLSGWSSTLPSRSLPSLRRQLLMRSGGGLQPPWVTR